jgi:hypothetical protein
MRIRAALLLGIIILCVSVVAAAPSLAQTGSGYDLSWSTIDGGGASASTGNGYELGGTIGQPDAGMLNGGGYELSGGFWINAMIQSRIYLPLILRNP